MLSVANGMASAIDTIGIVFSRLIGGGGVPRPDIPHYVPLSDFFSNLGQMSCKRARMVSGGMKMLRTEISPLANQYMLCVFDDDQLISVHINARLGVLMRKERAIISEARAHGRMPSYSDNPQRTGIDDLRSQDAGFEPDF